jgi:hypothetical protein
MGFYSDLMGFYSDSMGFIVIYWYLIEISKIKSGFTHEKW